MAEGRGDEYKIYIGNMDPATTGEQIEAAIRECMGQDIPIMSVRIIKDTDGRCKGYGFVGFQSPEIVREVIEKMDGMEVEGRNIKVNETKSDGYRPKDRGPYDARDRDRDRDRDRSRQPQSDSYHPPPDPSGRKYRISINNLPEHFTWRELKDFLRTGAQSVSYANVSRPGFGVGDYDTAADREDAIRKLDGCKVDGSIVTVREMAHPADGAGRDDERGPPAYAPDPYRPSHRDEERRVDPYPGGYDPRGSRPPSYPPSEGRPRFREPEYPDRPGRHYEEPADPYERRVRPRADGPPTAYPADYDYGRDYPIAPDYGRKGPAPVRPPEYGYEDPRGPAPYPRQAPPYREGGHLPPPRHYEEDARGPPSRSRPPVYDEPPSSYPPRQSAGPGKYGGYPDEPRPVRPAARDPAYPAYPDQDYAYGADRSRGARARPPPADNYEAPGSRTRYAPY